MKLRSLKLAGLLGVTPFKPRILSIFNYDIQGHAYSPLNWYRIEELSLICHAYMTLITILVHLPNLFCRLMSYEDHNRVNLYFVKSFNGIGFNTQHTVSVLQNHYT